MEKILDNPTLFETEGDKNLEDLFPAEERGLYMYYGRLGQGKTYAMTADVIEALKNGQVVYTNYPLRWDGFDQRKSRLHLFFGLLGFKRFYEFFPVNWHYIEVDEDFHDKLATLTDCIVAIDEAYVAFDSYEMAKLSLTKRKNVLHTRHFNRSIWYTTQRPTNVHVVLRGNTNVFYRCKKLMSFPVTLFLREEFDLDADEKVADTQKPLSRKWYLGKKEIYEAYDTKYLRNNLPKSQTMHVRQYILSYGERIRRFFTLKREKSKKI